MPPISRRGFLRSSLQLAGGLALRAVAALPPQPPPGYYFTHGDPGSNKISLTFDDGWFPDKVEAVVEQLLAYRIPATFFPVGRPMSESPSLWADIIDAGFDLHNHTWTHADLSSPETNVRYQLRRWEETYASLGRGTYGCKILRLPANRGRGLPVYSVARSMGYVGVAGYSLDTYDYLPDPGVLLRTVLRIMSGGMIIVFHFVDSTVAAIPHLRARADELGLEFVRLHELPGTPVYRDGRGRRGAR